MTGVFDKTTFRACCDALAAKDKDLRRIIVEHGYPPMWYRKPGFETLVHIILEQQVSLASAKAALDKLKQKINPVNPKNFLLLDDEALKACYFSRQKAGYARQLAAAIIRREFSIAGLQKMPDEEVRAKMKTLKGIGDWTADVFLMMSLRRSDCFPTGDVALMKSVKRVKRLAADCSAEEVLAVARQWRPHRTIAAYLLWHDYLSRRKKPNRVQEVQVSDTTKLKEVRKPVP